VSAKQPPRPVLQVGKNIIAVSPDQTDKQWQNILNSMLDMNLKSLMDFRVRNGGKSESYCEAFVDIPYSVSEAQTPSKWVQSSLRGQCYKFFLVWRLDLNSKSWTDFRVRNGGKSESYCEAFVDIPYSVSEAQTPSKHTSKWVQSSLRGQCCKSLEVVITKYTQPIIPVCCLVQSIIVFNCLHSVLVQRHPSF
jgi:hypothetical protein